MEPTFQSLAGCPHPSRGPRNNAGLRVGWKDPAPPQVPYHPFLSSLAPTSRSHLGAEAPAGKRMRSSPLGRLKTSDSLGRSSLGPLSALLSL